MSDYDKQELENRFDACAADMRDNLPDDIAAIAQEKLERARDIVRRSR